MSRHAHLKQKIEKEMEENESDNDDNYDDEEPEFNEQQQEVIANLCDMTQISREKAIKILQQTNGNFDKAVDIITKQKDKQAKKEKQRQQKQKKQVEKKLEEEKKKKKKIQAQHEHQLKKRSSISPQRKISSDSISRKSSYIVQQYDTTHYNLQYPSLQTEKNSKPSKTLNIVVVGHVDSGKSTLVGMFLHELKQISKKQSHKNQKLSKELGKQSFKYAFVTDQMEEERVRGVTIDVGVKKVQLQDKQIVFLDSPGHRDFIPNMISGAAQADYAILVIDSTHFQASFISGGQTKQHAYIVRSLGVHKLIVVMNKMDLNDWNCQAFEIIRQKLNFYLLRIGFTQQNIIYIPVSAYYGLNIVKKTPKPFQSAGIVYNQSLLQIIDSLSLPIRPVDKPFRMTIANCYESPQGKLKGHCLSGKIEGGVLKKQDKLVILPQNCQCIIKQIIVNEEKTKEAIVGDNVNIQIKLIDQTFFQTIKFGNVLSSLKYSIPVSNKFVVEALALELDLPILKGTPIILYIGTNKSPARISKINYIFDPKNGTLIKKNPKSIRSNECAEIEIETQKKICVELFSNFKSFSRVILRQKNSTLCVGTVKKIR